MLQGTNYNRQILLETVHLKKEQKNDPTHKSQQYKYKFSVLSIPVPPFVSERLTL